ASEVGIVDVDVHDVVERGRLGPGEMLVVDLEQHQLLIDSAFKLKLGRDASRPRLSIVTMPRPKPMASSATGQSVSSVALQLLFGYSREDVQFVLSSMSR